MSIRHWAKKILKNPPDLKLLRQAQAEISNLPIGPKVEIDWYLPNPVSIFPKPSPEIRLLHSIANIEHSAIYLYWDTISLVQAPASFYSDLAEIAIEECEHYLMLVNRLQELGCTFPQLKCNDYMKEFNDLTKDSILNRLLFMSIYSEGRALDSKQRILEKLKGYNSDHISAKILEKIINDEVAHLRNGMKWFYYFAQSSGLDPKKAHDEGMRKLDLVYRAPFNKNLRDVAGVPEDWYNKYDVF